MGIGKRIKEARENKGYTQAELAKLLNVTPSAITNYENNTSHPKEKILYDIIKKLDVDANFLFQDEVKIKSNALAKQDTDMLRKYNNLDKFDKEVVNSVIDNLSKREKPINKEHSQDAEHSKEFIVLEPPKIIPCYPKLASAGTGEYLFNDIPVDMIETENNEADFALGVNGNSMEPKFNDGDYVLVKKQSTVNLNDIAIYIIDGECLIKQYKGNHLHSLNPEFNDVMFNMNQNIKCVGKVLGKV